MYHKLLVFGVCICLLIGVQNVYAAYIIDGTNNSITTNTLWGKTSPAADGIYWVTANVLIWNGATLTIEPGVIVKFDPSRYFQVGSSNTNSGILNAQGTSGNPIIFTSIKDDRGADTNGDGSATSPSPGDWIYLYFRNGSNSTLDWCEIAYAGQLSAGFNRAVRIYNGGAPSVLSDCTVTQSAGYGFFLDTAGNMPATFTGNTFSNNATWPIRCYVRDAGAIPSGTTFTGNGNQGVLVMAETLPVGAYTWLKLSVPYYLAASTTVPSGATLTLSAGVVLKINTARYLAVSGGTLNMSGTSAEHVVFTSILDDAHGGDTNADGSSTTPSSGDWQYINFTSGSSGSINYAEILYAGSNVTYPYAIYCNGGSPTSITNSDLRYSNGWAMYENTTTLSSFSSNQVRQNNIGGLLFSATATGPSTFSNNVFSNNGTWPISLYADSAATIDSSNTFISNGNNGVKVSGGNTGSGTRTWSALSVPYYVTSGVTVPSGSELVISAGTVVKFETATWLTIHSGMLTAQGSSSNRIIFTSYRDDSYMGDTNGDGAGNGVTGDWRYIQFRGTGTGTLDYCDVLYSGGYTTYPYAIYCNGATPSRIAYSSIRYSNGYALYTTASGMSDFSNNTVADNASYGLYFNATGIVPSTFTGNTFSSNGNWPLRMYAQDLTKLTVSNSFSANDLNGIYCVGEILSSGIHQWKKLNVPYYLNGKLELRSGANLSLDPGVIIKLDVLGNIYVNGGALSAAGNAGNHIYFTSFKDDSIGGDTNGDGSSSGVPGDWRYLRFASGSANFDYCDFLYGGGYITYPYLIWSSGTGISALTNCRIAYSANYGLYVSVASAAPSSIANSTFENNAFWPITLYARDAAKLGTGNTFTSPQYNAVYVLGELIPTGTYTWKNQGVPFYITGTVELRSSTTLSVDPGTLIKLESSGNFYLNGGTFNAVGTSGSHIVFTSYRDDSRGGDSNGDGASSGVAGDWRYLRYAGAGTGTLSYCDLFYGGGYPTYPYMIYNQSGSPTEISNCLISDSLYNGVNWSQNYYPTTFTNNTISNCGQYALITYAGGVSKIAANTQFSGNGTQAVKVVGETLSSVTPVTHTWAKISVPIQITSAVTVGSNVTLNIEGGNILKFDGGRSITVDSGVLNVQGTSTDPVVATSIKDDSYGGDTNGDGSSTSPAAGDWQYIRFINGGSGTINYATVAYGGSSTVYTGMIECYSGTLSSIDNSIIRDSARVGVRFRDSSVNPTVTNSTIRDNDYGIQILNTGVQPTIGGTSGQGNSIYANTTYGVQNAGTLCVNARFNYWGANDGPNDPSSAADACLLGANAGSGDSVSDNVDYLSYIGSPDVPPDPPTPSSPSSPSEVSSAKPTLTVTNSSSTGTLLYHFQVARNASFTLELQNGNVSPGTGSTSWVVPNALSENTTYYWRCRVEDQGTGLPSTWTDTQRFFVNAVNNIPYTPSLWTPTYGQQVNSATPTLICINTSDPDDNETMDYPLTYEFEIYSDPGMTTVVETSNPRASEGAGTTSYTVITTLSEDTEYWWRVRAHDGVQYGNWSGGRPFFVTVVNSAPDAPTLNSPADGTYIATITPQLRVNNANDPDRDTPLTYAFEVYSDSGLSNLVTQNTSVSGGCCSGTTAWTVGPALNNSRWYWWQSNATDAALSGPYMSSASFITLGFPLPETAEHGYLPTLGSDLVRGDRVIYTFPGLSGDVTILFEVYNNVGDPATYRILINGIDTASQGPTATAAWSGQRSVVLSDADVNDSATNVMVFTHPTNTPGSYSAEWGIRNVGVNVPPPSILTATPYNTVIDLRWAAESSASGYNLYRATTSGGPYSKVNTTVINGLFYRDIGLLNSTTYYYVVRSVDSNNFEGLNSSEANATPTTSGGITPITDLVVILSGNDLLLKWSTVTTETGVQNYRVYRVYGTTPTPYSRSEGDILGNPSSNSYTVLGAGTDAFDYTFDVAVVDTFGSESND